MKKSGSLLMDLKVGQSLSLDGGRIVLSLEEKSGQRVKIRFVTDDGISIERTGREQHGGTASGARQAQLGTKVTG